MIIEIGQLSGLRAQAVIGRHKLGSDRLLHLRDRAALLRRGGQRRVDRLRARSVVRGSHRIERGIGRLNRRPLYRRQRLLNDQFHQLWRGADVRHRRHDHRAGAGVQQRMHLRGGGRGAVIGHAGRGSGVQRRRRQIVTADPVNIQTVAIGLAVDPIQVALHLILGVVDRVQARHRHGAAGGVVFTAVVRSHQRRADALRQRFVVQQVLTAVIGEPVVVAGIAQAVAKDVELVIRLNRKGHTAK